MRTAAFALVTVVTLAVTAGSLAGRKQDSTFLDNGRVRVGVSLVDGAKITYVGRASGDGRNLVQDVQPSYYSGPYRHGFPGWHAFASGGTVLTASNDGTTIYTKTAATQEFAGPCECVFEQWVRLRGDAVLVHNRLTAWRADATRYDASPQELPALYTTGRTYRVFSYDGPTPYVGAPVREVTDDAGGFFRPGPSWLATEHWAAVVDDDDFGVGLFKPDLVNFSGIPGTPEAAGGGRVNGYLTSWTPEVIDANQTYDYDYTLVVGSLTQIRAYAYAHRPDARPKYRFRSDRQHWWYRDATDLGSPVRGALRLTGLMSESQLYGPETWWRADGVPVVYVRARWLSQPSQLASLYWSTPGAGFSPDRRMLLVPYRDNRFHTYAVRLADLPGYAGWITGLRLDPVSIEAPGTEVDVACISWRPCPVDRRAEAAIVGGGPVPYLDSFDGSVIDGSFWLPNGTGPSVKQTHGELEIVVPTTTQPDPVGHAIVAGVLSRCVLRGDFDAQVDYRLLDWPAANGVHLNFGTNFPQAVGRQNMAGELVFAWFPPGVVNLAHDDSSGSLRLVKRGSTISGFIRGRGGWTRLLTAANPYDDAQLQLSISSREEEWSHRLVRVAFDNFRINTGRLACPA